MIERTVPAVQVSGLTKQFGETTAVNHVDLSVPSGTFYGIVGVNGAGKSTLLSMIVGLIKPNSGNIMVAGHDVWEEREQALSSLGVMLEGLSLPERLTGIEVLEYTAKLRGVDADWRQRAADLLEILELDRAPHTLIIDYSTGMRKKIGLALALIHRPKVLVLDEPFEAIDPVSAHSIELLLKQYVAGGGTVLLSSHVMEVVERNCEHVAFMKDGHIHSQGAVKDIVSEESLNDVFIDVMGSPPVRTIEWLARPR